MPTFVWTEKGHSIHISDNGRTTRCGWTVAHAASADDVNWYGVCQKCRHD